MVIEREPDTTIAVALRTAQFLDISMTSAARAAGLTRTRAYALLGRTAGIQEYIPVLSLRRLVAAALDNHRPLGLISHAERLGVKGADLSDALGYLGEYGAAEVLARTSDIQGSHITEEFWIPGSDSQIWLRRQIDVLRLSQEPQQLESCYVIFLALPDGARNAIANAADQLKPEKSTVIEAGNASRITWDELLMSVAAADSREALDAARDLWDQICVLADLQSAPFCLREIEPPIRRRQSPPAT